MTTIPAWPNRESRPSRFLPARLTTLLFLALWLAGCIGPVPLPATEDDYLRAVNDAIDATPDEIDYNLVAITPYDSRVIWEGAAGDSRVKMAVYTDFAGYDSEVGQTITLPGPSTTIRIFVTSAGEWPDFARMVLRSREDPDARVRQLLGLPPDNPPSKFVQLWVNPTDLYRPSPDPEITDHEAELSWPVSAAQPPPDQSYMDWFDNREATIYYGSKPYPWTRLGYTYDWGNRHSHVGMSEFVMAQGASVTVISSQSTADFLHQQAGQ